ncbi:serpentine type 7TM GPCR chemoreceptor srbc domain-containing protein [Ditylenchus destructor]|nr:serpentine type 7TM GPCR chemoreceptor srbc domain-containing protein [Ditylenchus destructor]
MTEITECRVFACLFKRTGQAIFTATRTIGGFINFATGAFFFYKLWSVAQANKEASRAVYHSTSLNANNKSSNNKLNRMAGLIIAMELLLNFVPQLVSFLATKMFSVTISQYIGPYNVYLTSIEVFILSVMYSRILYKSMSKDSLTSVNPRIS